MTEFWIDFLNFLDLTGSQGTSLAPNNSERFESRWVHVKVATNTNAIMLRNMNDSVLGVWVAHGEGRFDFSSNKVFDRIKAKNCIALSYADDDGVETMK